MRAPGIFMFWVYILHSETTGEHYCGHTADLVNRLRQHNDPAYVFTRTTKKVPGPWMVLWQAECATRSEAMALEKQIKKQGVSRYLRRAQSAESRPGRD